MTLDTLLAMMNLVLEGCSALSHWARACLVLAQQSAGAGVAPLALTILVAAHGVSRLTYSALYKPALGC